ncbi:MAG: nicotinate phosphoribosyltransferase [Chloroflexi bacterium]|nr:nicotinate phosphoribosyltransferase [Chloroflexota bacterium]MCC6893551.1 nicotinate phosphoribosyltransferase [Anaerolineae bacterium]
MTIFDHKRLPSSTFKLDVEGLRRGYYSDKYFENIVQVLEGAKAADYTFAGHSPRDLPVDPQGLPIGDLEVEAQIFNRRTPFAVVAGVDAALAMLRHATGYFDNSNFIPTVSKLEVQAVEDGVLTMFAGDTEDVQPVIRIRGRYRDFALLETPILGVLTRASRVATNVYNIVKAARGKSLLFFPARFDLPEVQATDGYAYWLAVQRYNAETGANVVPFVSTDAQAAWWGGHSGGTVPHALIACFLADTSEAMLAFARYVSPQVSRVVLADFNNDSIGAALATLAAYWPHYLAALQSGDAEAQKRWTLMGVRLDTGATMRDVSLQPDDPTGVNPVLVRLLREALNHAWEAWNVPPQWVDAAKQYCQNVKIVVSGGFSIGKIMAFEDDGVPVDMYGVGSSLLRNAEDVNTDYTMDVVRVNIRGTWVDVAKLGRKPDDNPDLAPVDFSRWT